MSLSNLLDELLAHKTPLNEIVVAVCSEYSPTDLLEEKPDGFMGYSIDEITIAIQDAMAAGLIPNHPDFS